MTESYEIGTKVRVVDKDGSVCRKGIISYYHMPSNLCDIIYDDNNDENDVSISRIQPIEIFEENVLSTDISSTTFKEYGNILFNKKDYIESEKYYLLGIKKLLVSSSNGLSNGFRKENVGSYTIIQKTNNSLVNFRIGMISDINQNGQLIDVVYLNNFKLIDTTGNEILLEEDFDDENEVEDEDNINVTERVIANLPQTLSDLELLRSLYLNLCRIKNKLKVYGWAIKYSSLALIVTKFICYTIITNSENNNQNSSSTLTHHNSVDNNSKLIKQLADAYYLRGSILLTVGRPQLAKIECQRMEILDSVRSHKLSIQIDQFLKKRQQSNKTLAVEMSKWVESAMSQYQNLQSLDSTDANMNDEFNQGKK